MWCCCLWRNRETGSRSGLRRHYIFTLIIHQWFTVMHLVILVFLSNYRYIWICNNIYIVTHLCLFAKILFWNLYSSWGMCVYVRVTIWYVINNGRQTDIGKVLSVNSSCHFFIFLLLHSHCDINDPPPKKSSLCYLRLTPVRALIGCLSAAHERWQSLLRRFQVWRGGKKRKVRRWHLGCDSPTQLMISWQLSETDVPRVRDGEN